MPSTPDRAGAARWLHRHVVYPLVVGVRGEGSVFRRLRALEQLQWRSEDELRERQSARLARTLGHAAASPYYRQRWGRLAQEGAGDDPFECLRSLPLLTKADLQESAATLRSTRPPAGRTTTKVTGGSTGQPVTIVKHRSAIAAEMAASWLGYGWFGIRRGDRGVRFWGQPATLKRRLRFAAADLATHRIRFSAFAFGDDDLERYWRRCLRYRPDFFYGYASMLGAFAEFVLRRGYDGSALPLKAIVSTSEVLTEPQRRAMREAFGVPVQNEYGCGELGPLAYECEAGGLHLMTENQVVEVLRPDGSPAAPGESGEVVVTDLNNFAMPLVRYRVGDLATPARACTCGRGFPTLERVWGREYDFVQGPDGRRYHGEFFMYLFEDLRSAGAAIGKFQVVQRAADRVELRVVPAGDFHALEEARLLAVARERLPGVHLSVLRVPELPPLASGKTAVVQNPWLRQAGGAAAVQPPSADEPARASAGGA